MIIVDTSVWIDFFAGIETLQSVWLRSVLGGPQFGLTDLILCELSQGVRDDRSFLAMRRELADLTVFDSVGEHIAVSSARNYRQLRSRGITVRKTIDCLIATFCIENDFALLHRDRDFDAFETHLGLRVIHPAIV
jgi:predicted nucleic acid-binding protein